MSRARSLLLVLIVGAGLAPLGCSGRGGRTPADLVRLEVRYVREGDYHRIWSLYTENYQKKLRDEVRKMQGLVGELLAKGGPNVKSLGSMIPLQYGVSPEQFVRLDPRVAYDRMFEHQRERWLGLTVVGKPKIRGDRATLTVKDGGNAPPAIWHLVKRDGRWLVDDIPIGPSGGSPR